jgi:hypothetical protein
MRDVLVPVQECREFGVVVAVGLVGDERIGFQYRFEALAPARSLVPDCSEMFEVAGDRLAPF